MRILGLGCALAASVAVSLIGCRSGKPGDGKLDLALADQRTTPRVFAADGAHDFHVDITRPPTAAALLKPQGVRALLAHLDDTTPTATVLQTPEGPVTVPLGYLCLDLLLQVATADSPVFAHPNAADAAPWPIVDERFFFPPDVLTQEGGEQRMRGVRAAWEELAKHRPGVVGLRE